LYKGRRRHASVPPDGDCRCHGDFGGMVIAVLQFDIDQSSYEFHHLPDYFYDILSGIAKTFSSAFSSASSAVTMA
jgi:hypothetical protein